MSRATISPSFFGFRNCQHFVIVIVESLSREYVKEYTRIFLHIKIKCNLNTCTRKRQGAANNALIKPNLDYRLVVFNSFNVVRGILSPYLTYFARTFVAPIVSTVSIVIVSAWSTSTLCIFHNRPSKSIFSSSVTVVVPRPTDFIAIVSIFQTKKITILCEKIWITNNENMFINRENVRELLRSSRNIRVEDRWTCRREWLFIDKEYLFRELVGNLDTRSMTLSCQNE